MNAKAQAWLYIVLGVALVAYGFVVSGPTVPDFWYWLAMPIIVTVGGLIRLGMANRKCEHKWVEVHRGRGHDIVLNIDRCEHCLTERDWLVPGAGKDHV